MKPLRTILSLFSAFMALCGFVILVTIFRDLYNNTPMTELRWFGNGLGLMLAAIYLTITNLEFYTPIRPVKEESSKPPKD